MEHIIHFIYIVSTLFLIVGSCVVFTNAVEHLGKAYNLNEGAVGSILAAIGTALPETIVPLVAIFGAYFTHSSVDVGKDIGIGAILGAPFLLCTLAMFVTGVGVLIFSRMKKRENVMNADHTVMFRDMKFFFFSYSLAILAGFIPITFIKWTIAAFLLGYYLFYVFRTIKKCTCTPGSAGCEVEDLDQLLLERIFKRYNIWVIWAQIIVSILGLIFFSHVFVEQIKYFADIFSVNPLILSLILAPVATELPEMFNSVLWVSQSKDTLALGNITGAMVFQSCIPMAIGIVLTPWIFGLESIVNIAVVYSSSALLFFNLFKNKAFSPHILIASGVFYAVYLGFIVVEILN